MLISRKFDKLARLEGGRYRACRVLDSETTLLGEKIKANSWVAGVMLFVDHIWQKVLSVEYQSFSIGDEVCVRQEFDLDEREIDFISFVLRGRTGRYFLVKVERRYS